MRPGRQGQREGFKLDPHEDFILGLVEDVKDISLAEIAARLAEERGLTACPATIWYSSTSAGSRTKKDGARQRAAARGCESRPPEVV
ncbi:MAG: hypothetical protein ACR2J1_01690 [Methyloceanibacter sp.]|uniref:hypothetical protein n=1 Tax=Methyloceanibacter sp. TaxID=1965321 RepID=UPI003D9AEF0D